MGPFLYVLLSVVALLLFFTVGRAIYCWYTKVNVVVERLDDIILKLNNISGSLSTTKSAEAAPAVIEVNKAVVEAKPAPVEKQQNANNPTSSNEDPLLAAKDFHEFKSLLNMKIENGNMEYSKVLDEVWALRGEKSFDEMLKIGQKKVRDILSRQ